VACGDEPLCEAYYHHVEVAHAENQRTVTDEQIRAVIAAGAHDFT